MIIGTPNFKVCWISRGYWELFHLDRLTTYFQTKKKAKENRSSTLCSGVWNSLSEKERSKAPVFFFFLYPKFNFHMTALSGNLASHHCILSFWIISIKFSFSFGFTKELQWHATKLAVRKSNPLYLYVVKRKGDGGDNFSSPPSSEGHLWSCYRIRFVLKISYEDLITEYEDFIWGFQDLLWNSFKVILRTLVAGRIFSLLFDRQRIKNFLVLFVSVQQLDFFTKAQLTLLGTLCLAHWEVISYPACEAGHSFLCSSPHCFSVCASVMLTIYPNWAVLLLFAEARPSTCLRVWIMVPMVYSFW